ncbi:hypothetical protein TorRG33x02_347030, partial [Trema orientale]
TSPLPPSLLPTKHKIGALPSSLSLHPSPSLQKSPLPNIALVNMPIMCTNSIQLSYLDKLNDKEKACDNDMQQELNLQLNLISSNKTKYGKRIWKYTNWI